jgi:Bacteriophage abortive infection AbiH
MPTKSSTSINRLVLIGNGFDLAHGLKTSYGHFIFWYFNDCLTKAKEKFESGKYSYESAGGRAIVFENDLLQINFDKYSFNTIKTYTFRSIDDIKQFIGIASENKYQYHCDCKLKSSFLSSLIKGFCQKKWVDIENHYYNALCKFIDNSTGRINENKINQLNKEFELIKKELEVYLSTIDQPRVIESLRQRIYEEQNSSGSIETLGSVMFLNFNYTYTPELYKKDKTDIIYIHGQLNDEKNPIIFGYGDERDGTYDLLEKANIPDVLTHIKSFDYFKTNNYDRLLAFLESEYDVYIMGHSCGLSDRTLLSTIFEHENCRLIKIFYYEKMERYRETTYEISRHFTSKAEMRRKVINFADCSPMPQLTP